MPNATKEAIIYGVLYAKQLKDKIHYNYYNTENIDNCVRSKWLPNKTDLDKYNKFFNELPFNEKQLIKNSSGGESKNITYKDNTLKYIVVGIFISIILSIIIITI